MRMLFVQDNAISESIGVCCLSASLKQAGHHCDLLILTHPRNSNWLDDVRDFAPDLIGISVFTGMEESAYRLVRAIKKAFDLPVVAGGPHPTFYPAECMQACPEIDFVCRGDGEEALLGLVDAIAKTGDTTRIPGIWTWQNGQIVRNSIAPLIKDVNGLPLPDREIYFKYRFLRDFPLKRFISGYGCPYKCGYCNQPLFEQEYARDRPAGKSEFIRPKRVDRLIEEIEIVRDTSRLRRVHFSDDLFCSKRSWLREFAEKYPVAIGLPFSCNLRFDGIDQERADLLKRSGCYAVQSGIESGNDLLRNTVIGKQLSREEIVRGAHLLRERGIRVYTTNIVALPGETIDQAIETIRLNQEIRSNFVRVNTLMPFPKTLIAEYAKAKGYLPPNYGLKDLNTDDSLHIHCRTPHENEFKNIACLFRIFVRHPFLMRFFPTIIRMKNNWFFRLLGLGNILQDARYFQVDYWSGFRFYLNTIHRDHSGEAMHWVPGTRSKRQTRS